MISGKGNGITRKEFLIGTGVAGAMVAAGAASTEAIANDLASTTQAATVTLSADTKAKQQTLFTNANVFDGEHEALIESANVLVEDNLIKEVSTRKITAAGATVVNGGGRTLMPGLIDAHYHSMMAALPLSDLLSSADGWINLAAAKNAEQLLLQGFTSIRDAGGNSFSLKRAIDRGLYPGPRIYPSGPMISQTSGHADYRAATAVPSNPAEPLLYIERNGYAVVADGVPEVIKRVREALRMGATQIKLAAGGGVASNFDPLDVAQYTYEELKAAVDVAATWNTYVMVHAYTPKAIQTALKAGVQSIEHGQLMDEATAKMIAEKGAWLSLQPFLDDEDAIPFPEGSDQRKKQLTMTRGTDTAYRLAKKFKIKTAFGTDVLFDPKLATKQGKQLAKLTRWYSPFEVLKMATSDNAAVLALCGPRNPYQAGPFGVVKKGAYADLILVDGNPLKNLDLVANADKNFAVIMKDGKIHKNTLR